MEAIETKVANALATGAPGSIELGGKTYLVAQPTKADFITLQKHVTELWKRANAAPLTAVASQIAGLPAELQQMAVAEAVKLGAGNQEPSKDALMGHVISKEGVSFFAWVLIRKNHSTVQLETIKAEIDKAPELIDEITAKILDAASLKDANPN